MELLQNLGINSKILLAQIINFFVLFWVLKKFAYKPVLDLLEERKNKIEKGLADAEKSQQKLVEIEKKEENVLAKAHKEAQEIINKAEEQAKKNGEDIVVEAKQKIEKLVKNTKSSIEEEKQKMLTEVKTEVAGLVALATERIIDEKIDKNKDEEIIKKVITSK